MYNNINRRHAHKQAVCKRPQNALPKTVFGNTKDRAENKELSGVRLVSLAGVNGQYLKFRTIWHLSINSR